MTASEFKYLKTIIELYLSNGNVKLTDIASKLQFSKASVYRAVERLSASEYLKRHCDKTFAPTNKGLAVIKEYMLCIDFIKSTIEANWKIKSTTAYIDAVNTICIISDASRNAILNYLKRKSNG